jgi:hypothetical protein
LRLARTGQIIEVEGDRDRIDTARLFPGAPVRLAFRRMRIFPRDAAGASEPAAAALPAADAPIPLADRRMRHVGS